MVLEFISFRKFEIFLTSLSFTPKLFSSAASPCVSVTVSHFYLFLGNFLLFISLFYIFTDETIVTIYVYFGHILSTLHFANLTFCQLDILPTWHFPTWHFSNLTFFQLDILPTWHFANLMFCQLDISPTLTKLLTIRLKELKLMKG